MTELFKIAEVSPLGDSDTGESYVVTVTHTCLDQREVVINASVGRQCKGEVLIECKRCRGVVYLVKDISTQPVVSISSSIQSDS